MGTTNPVYKIDVVGDINSSTVFRIGGTQICSSSGCTSSSDSRLKQDIHPLNDSLDHILKLQGVSYHWKDSKKFSENQQIGLIAQDLEKVYPQVVVTDSKTGLKSVAYDHLVAPLIEAVKTLYNRMTGLEGHQAAQERRIANVEALKADKAETEVLRTENAQLKTESAQLKVRADKAEKENAEIKARLDKLEKLLNSK